MDKQFETLAVHAGIEPDESTGAVMTPIYQTSTYAQSAPGVHKGFEYSRTDNPTRTVLQTQLAALEMAQHALVFSSGMAAIDAVLNLLSSGDHIIAGDDLYGGTRRLFSRLAVQRGIKFDFVDLSQPANLLKALTETTKVVWAESPTNPLLKVIGLGKLAEFCRSHGLLSIVDNTFMSPYLQNPLKHGINIAMHSMTKSINGHSDVVMGALAYNEPTGLRLQIAEGMSLHQRLRFIQNSIGAVPGPFDCWLVLRGIKTLAVRMERASANALAIAQFLQGHPKIERVIYPGLESHSDFELSRKQCRLPGAMISFYLRGPSTAATTFLSNLRIFAIAESLGGVESLAEHPAVMTHASVPAPVRNELGISDTMVRLSVGIESVSDLIDDLRQALDSISA